MRGRNVDCCLFWFDWCMYVVRVNGCYISSSFTNTFPGDICTASLYLLSLSHCLGCLLTPCKPPPSPRHLSTPHPLQHLTLCSPNHSQRAWVSDVNTVPCLSLPSTHAPPHLSYLPLVSPHCVHTHTGYSPHHLSYLWATQRLGQGSILPHWRKPSQPLTTMASPMMLTVMPTQTLLPITLSLIFLLLKLVITTE